MQLARIGLTGELVCCIMMSEGGDGMKITINYDPKITETEVVITCRELTGEVREMISAVTLADNTITGAIGDETYFIPLGDILYFESVDRKVFFYTSEQTYETMSKMYAIEERLADTYFARVAKSFIVNLKKVRSIKAERASRMCLTLQNGEKLIVSRQYLGTIKEKLGV